ncbi:alpha-amylase [Flavobacterium salilacus subsp. salilacus]|uniref:alpha-amylase n=1 Tax=Flavobacterium TaxID=237 RepID=UPI0010756E2E|nr:MULTISPECIES: alpha-amylase [Flavobacterium]KAF2519533.1 alpha-amylase [Flavobacterium salilacus subsp. salilacus]MBE1614569.1 alpha-amylase [Flavobacterium sp. SaA2.13]
MKCIFTMLIAALLLSGCSKDSDALYEGEQQNKLPSETSQPETAGRSIGSKVMMQAFYWDVPAGGTWWNTVSGKVPSWASAGIDAIWLPPATKAQNGPFSMGYDPFDYYDFGSYNQMGSTETRFGSLSEIQSLISTAHNNDLSVIADIVINHNSGGASQYNPFTSGSTYTDFQPASGLFTRSYYDFHPNDVHAYDSGSFGGFPDLCHDKVYVQNWLYNNSNSIAKYYKNVMGFDGWRFDYVKGFEPWVVKNFKNAAGGFAVGEYWDGNAATLDWWTGQAEASAFDFACYYKMRDAFGNNDLTQLNGDMLLKRNSYRAVTFVANHDTDEIYNNKLLAYAYILTHEGYPCVFYRDYEEWLDKNKLNNLIWIHNNKASGGTSYLYADNDEYVARRNGSPGLIVYINISNSWQERWVDTNWSNTVIKDFTGNSGWEPTTQGDSWVKIQAPPNSYTVWSVK